MIRSTGIITTLLVCACIPRVASAPTLAPTIEWSTERSVTHGVEAPTIEHPSETQRMSPMILTADPVLDSIIVKMEKLKTIQNERIKLMEQEQDLIDRVKDMHDRQ